jgi:predicted nucleic acid-binding protein
LEVLPATPMTTTRFWRFRTREKAAISLGHSLHADVILIDDRKGVAAAAKVGLQVSGTLGLWKRAGQRNLLDLAEAFTLLKKADFATARR